MTAPITAAVPGEAERPGRIGGHAAGGKLGALALLLAALVSLPLLGLLAALLEPDTGAVLGHLLSTVLPRYALNSAALAIGVALGVALVGVSCAWLVAACEFPGRRLFEWALVLPLAMPAYVVAYAYADFLQFSGPVQSALREVTGWRAREYWFPDVRSLPGAIVLFVSVLFPYVYLPVRAAFLERSPNLVDAARLLGLRPVQAFVRVALPLARPALAAGVALALMEVLADFGVASYFALETFSVGIYKAWFGLGERAAAAQLSLALLALVLLVLWLERFSRRRARFGTGARSAPTPMRLRGGWAWAAWAVCALPVAIGFALPAAVLLRLALREAVEVDPARYVALVWNSITVAGLTAVVAVVAALMLAYAARLRPIAAVRAGVAVAGLGYAVPGAVMAVAILVPLAALDNALNSWAQAWLGVSTGLLLTGSIAALVYACAVRFLALALGNVEAGLSRITPGMDLAARSLGCGPGALLARVHAPLLVRSLLVAGLLVFVDTLKELPATLVLRPFNFDTLATQAHNLAKDERLGAAAIPSLTLVVAGLVPVLVASRAMRRGPR
jgi:iron(III) transport system permease protein